jgi:large subunit ribosomal protein L32
MKGCTERRRRYREPFSTAIDRVRRGGLQYATPRFPPPGVLMAVPKRRQSNQKTRSRRAHDFLTPRQLTFCATCGKAVPTHRICGNCGHYMGRSVVKTEE